MVRNDYEGIKLVLRDDYEITITPNMKEISLSDWDIKEILLRYEECHCGCCDGSHEAVRIDPKELFKFIDSGGTKMVNEVREKNIELQLENNNLQNELKKYKDVIGELKDG